MSLTTRQINSLETKEKRYSVTDSHGLSLRVYPSGVKSWVLRISFNGRVCDITLGQYPEVSLKQARQKARTKRKEIGMDAPNGYTLRDAFKLWCGLKRGRIVSYKDEKRRLELYVMKTLGNRQLDEITAPLIIYTVKKLATANKLATLKRILMRVREIMDLAVCAGFIHSNPIERVSRVFPAPVTTPMPAVHWSDLTYVMQVMKMANEKTRALFLMSCLTALRPCENAKLRWSWIDGDVLTIPASEMKKRRAHRMPITLEMKKVFTWVKKINKGRKYVFEGRNSDSHVNTGKLAKHLRSTELKGRLVAHGIRSIARSWMADNKIRFEVAEACLSHIVGSAVSRSYQRSDYLEDRVGVMALWNRYVWDCAEKAGFFDVVD